MQLISDMLTTSKICGTVAKCERALTVKVGHCNNNDGSFWQIGFRTYSIRQCKFDGDGDGDGTYKRISTLVLKGGVDVTRSPK